ncbi:MAG: hypothetical protein KGK02_01550 [Rhodospirillales bacterium]|nr:hypothetical protein [Rhodospirillales bacterium]
MFISPLSLNTRGEFGVITNIDSCQKGLVGRLSLAVTRQEHQNILTFLETVLKSAHRPIDLEADAIIRAYLKRNPDAAYRLTMMAMELVGSRDIGTHTKPKRRGWLPVLLRSGQV